MLWDAPSDRVFVEESAKVLRNWRCRCSKFRKEICDHPNRKSTTGQPPDPRQHRHLLRVFRSRPPQATSRSERLSGAPHQLHPPSHARLRCPQAARQRSPRPHDKKGGGLATEPRIAHDTAAAPPLLLSTSEHDGQLVRRPSLCACASHGLGLVPLVGRLGHFARHSDDTAELLIPRKWKDHMRLTYEKSTIKQKLVFCPCIATEASFLSQYICICHVRVPNPPFSWDG